MGNRKRSTLIFAIASLAIIFISLTKVDRIYAEEHFRNDSIGYSQLLFDDNLKPRVKLLQLLQLVGMEIAEESTLEQINYWAQENLLRQGERWEEQTARFEELKPRIKPILKDLGFVDSISAHFKQYQGAIIHGCSYPTIAKRIQYLVEQWKTGVRFTTLYFLSSERPLDEQYEQRAVYKDLGEHPKTESEMNQLVWEQSEIPEDMRRNVQVFFITAPMKRDEKSGKEIRATTGDTVEAWLQTSPLQGCYLAVTNAPYIIRQDLVVRTVVSRFGGYTFDTIGSNANGQQRMAIVLDELARAIFQTKN